MSIPCDYHLHTIFSIDGKLSLPELCERAIALGIPEICTTDHVDFMREDAGHDYFRPDAYFAAYAAAREQYADRVTLRAGIEVGEPHRFAEQIAPLAGGYPFDFIIGSLHWAGPELVMSHGYFEGKSEERAYGDYFAELLRMVRAGGFDVVGHFDVPKRYGYDLYGRFDPLPHAEIIREVLRACVERGIGLEINTGTARRRVGVPSPEPEILRWYRELGGEILTIGSDGHWPKSIGYRLDMALELVRATGFTHLTTFEARQPRFIPLP